MRKIFKSSRGILLALVLLLAGPAAVTAQAAGVYDPVAEGVVSSYFYIDRQRGLITGIAPGTSGAKLSSLCVPSGGSLSQESLATGAVFSAGSESLTAVVTGDLNGDAAVTITDMLMIKSALLGSPVESLAAAAGDINYDGNMTITDFLQVKAYLLGIGGISGGRPAGTAADPILMMVPDSTLSWASGIATGAASFTTSDPAVAVVNEQGLVSALGQEGSAFVYALDADGNVLSRAQVGVWHEPLGIWFDASAFPMVMGQSQQLTPYFTHPVTPVVLWSSSDSSIVSVENGVLTGHNYGSAVVTACLENGNSAQITVTVAPPVTDICFDKDLYKVRPGASRVLGTILTPADTGEEIIYTSADPAVATVDGSGTVTGVGYGTTTVTATGKYSGLSASCYIKVCDVKQVAITFDDGPSNNTSRLLDYLRDSGIKATFFLVGSRLNQYPNTLAREVAEGHEIGYHSYAHVEQTTLSTEQIISDFNYSNQVLQDLTGASFTVWRTPGGGYSDRVLAAVPLPHIMWSVDTMDWSSRNANSVYWAILNNSRDGSIILLHDLYSSSVEGAIRAMEVMNAGDYEFMTVTELLSRYGTPPAPSVSYAMG